MILPHLHCFTFIYIHFHLPFRRPVIQSYKSSLLSSSETALALINLTNFTSLLTFLGGAFKDALESTTKVTEAQVSL